MPKNEKETRIELIDPALHRAGWEVLTTKNIIEASKACIETPVDGMPPTLENPSGHGYVDYVLFGENGKPLAIIEAKKSTVNEGQGKVQACLYADALEKYYGVRPVIYYTNGYHVRIIDGIWPDRPVYGFHTKDELEYLIQKRDFKLNDLQPNLDICGRYYQVDAIKEVMKQFTSQRSRSLIVLATGTGKTRVSCGITDIMLRNNFVKRVLFLADRKNLVKQAKEETFEKFLPTVPMMTIVEGKKEGEESKARIVFSTYQSMLSIIKDTSTCPYGIGHFDLIIVDEAHRSLFNKYGEIFDYFDAMMLGLTATPRNDIHKSTYSVFNIDKDIPNYEYDIVRGVKDGFLTYYRALDRTPDILKNGVVYDNLTPEEQEEYEDKFTEDDGTIPPLIEGKEFYNVITNKDTIREVLKDLMNEGIYVNNGDVLGKTIIFARDHNHAMAIQEEFKNLFPELCYTNNPNGVDYCVVIDNQIRYNEILQREFKEHQQIRIVISVDMMDTGVDIPEVVNLVFFKKVLSKIKFWQMIGRGTRICKDIKVYSAGKAYFERLTNENEKQLYQDKQGFMIFDICNVFPFFKQHPEGRRSRSEDDLSLYQKVFLQKVALYRAMHTHYSQLDIENKQFFENLRASLIDEVKSMNPNFIGVHKNLEYVHKYSTLDTWYNFSQNDFADIKKHIAPNVTGEIEAEGTRTFDYICYKFASNKYYKNADFVKNAKMLYEIAKYLYNVKAYVDDVKDHKATLEYIMTDAFINDSTTTQINSVREEIRDLMRYIENQIMIPIITDFNDRISYFEDAVEAPVDLRVTIDDFKTLEEKLKFFIQENPDEPLVNEVKNLILPSVASIQSFRSQVSKIAKSVDEYNSLFKDDNDLIVFVRKNLEFNPAAVEEFINQEKECGFNDEQLTYTRLLLLYISKNGYFDLNALVTDEVLSFNELFDNIQINKLINDIKEHI